MAPGDVDTAVADLRAEWGLDFRRVEAVLRRLAAGEPASLTDLVEHSGLARRGVQRVLTVLHPWLEQHADGVRLSGDGAPQIPSRPAPPDLDERLESFAAGLPPSRWRLDHVPATPATMADRARWLHRTYDLRRASVVCVGDHDLTSVAVGLTEPAADVAVVDIDDRILDHIGTVARAEGLPIVTTFADLRLGLPPSLAGSADLVFTDPPYTPDGVRLFLERGLEALRRSDHARIVFCYGYGDRHLVRGVEVQKVLQDLRLAMEALLPGFNRYRGAEAIGSRSNLYVCRPTTRTWTRRPPASGRDPRIYTRGAAAEEAPTDEGPAFEDDVPGVRVGAGGSVDMAEFVRRGAAWATSPKPQPPPFGADVAVNLVPHFGASLVRVLLLAATERIVVQTPAESLAASGLDDPGDPVRRLLEAAYELAVRHPTSLSPTGPGVARVVAVRHGREPDAEASAVLAHLVTHPGAKVGNAWREATLSWSRRTGTPRTRNEARRRIADAGLDPAAAGLRTWELPLGALRDVVAAVERVPR